MASEARASAQPEDCWNTIGVWGRKSPRCAELENVSHCRNCLVYIRAGRQKLDQPVPANYSMEWAGDWVNYQEVANKNTDLHRLLVFCLHDEYFALPIEQLHGVLPAKAATPLPHRNSKLLRGLGQVQGELCLHISLCGLLDMPQLKLDENIAGQYMLHITACAQPMLFAVSRIHGVVDYEASMIRPLPESISMAQRQLSLGMLSIKTNTGSRHACVLDTAQWGKLAEYFR